jgi:hypothetical protein
MVPFALALSMAVSAGFESYVASAKYQIAA